MEPCDAYPMEPTERYPLSALQEGMLFHHLRAPEGGVDIEQMVCTLPEALEVVPFRRAWERVVERHPAFRTAFQWSETAEPLQVVHPRVALPWQEEDWRELSAPQQAEHLASFLAADRRRGFRMDVAPLLRLTLIRLEEARYHLIWSSHHAIMDGRARPIVLDEVFAFYEALRRGQDLERALPRPFRDYIDWLQTRDLAAAESFWREQLRGFASPTPLLASRPPDAQSAVPDFQHRTAFLSEAATRALTQLTHHHHMSLGTLVQGAWALLLSRYSGEEDVVFGAVRSCRQSSIEGADQIIGLLLNTMPMRARVLPDAPWIDWLKQCQAEWRKLRDFQDTSLTLIQRWSEVPAGQPLFESMLLFENYQLDEMLRQKGQPWASRSFQRYDQTGFPLAISIYAGTRLCIHYAFDQNRFDGSTAARILPNFMTLLEGMADHPSARVADLPLLTAGERRRVLVDWNETAADYPKDTSLAELVEAQVERRPEALAVVCGQHSLDYRQLNARANQLAHQLRKQGAGPGSLVALYVDRSADLVTALLAIVKTGSAYLPLDPLFPAERLHYMLQDSGAPLLVTERSLLAALPDFTGSVVLLDDEAWQSNSTANPGIAAGPEQLAYLIYTSGSTGRPKGVQVPRGALNNLLWSMRAWLQIGERDRLLAVTTISFDIAGLEIWLPLLAGAQIVMAPRESLADGGALRGLLERHDITLLQATPTTWQLLFEAGWSGKANLQALCGGEAMPSDVAARLPGAVQRAWNFYGPTETTIWSTGFRLSEARPPIPIGRPLANTQIYILDGQRQPVPIGVAGELYIAGDGLACGYLNRPELTAQKFLPDPFCGRAARMYRTGDRARYREDGNIEYLGRLDHQVKIRGFRVELGEIEELLKAQAGIKQAVVTVREDTPGDPRLVAYLVTDFGPTQAAGGEVAENHTEQWKALWDVTYAGAAPAGNHDPSLAGWISSYTHEAIPAEVMYQQVAFTVERLLSFKPQRVLEIGCGTGLLLLKIAPHCSKYVGLDFSPTVLNTLRAQVRQQNLDHVELLERRADELDELPAGEFDLVVLNSIAQYFPSVDYLVGLLDKAFPLVAYHGIIQLGDLRNLALLEAFHLSEQAFLSPGTMPVAEFVRQMQHRMAREKELLIHPSLFDALQQRYPRLGHVTIQLKRGRDQNELTRFRYDVFLHLDAAPLEEAVTTVDWLSDGCSVAQVAERLKAARSGALRVLHVPNGRVFEYVSALSLLESLSHQTVDALRSKVQQVSGHAVDPEEMWALGEKLGYEAEISWSPEPGKEAYYDVTFRRGRLRLEPLPPTSLSVSSQPLPAAQYGNNPLHNTLTAGLVAQIRAALQVNLPDYMVPAAYVRLEALPLTRNGKLDRKALPAPEAEAFVTRAYEPPQGETETTLAAIWAELLKLDRVGRHDNFFELGGHSLLAMQVIARLRQAFHVEVPLQELFARPALALLAEQVVNLRLEQISPEDLSHAFEFMPGR